MGICGKFWKSKVQNWWSSRADDFQIFLSLPCKGVKWEAAPYRYSRFRRLAIENRVVREPQAAPAPRSNVIVTFGSEPRFTLRSACSPHSPVLIEAPLTDQGMKLEHGWRASASAGETSFLNHRCRSSLHAGSES